MNFITKVISGFFVTYMDFESYMYHHPDDFCYWIDKSLMTQSFFDFIDFDRKNIMSAIFIGEIGTNGTFGIQWTPWEEIAENNSRERYLELKGICFFLFRIFKSIVNSMSK